MSIKEIVFAYIHLKNGVIIYEELEAYVLSYKPGSAWDKSHWNYYRSNITSSNGRYHNEFSEIERRNLKEQAELNNNVQLKYNPIQEPLNSNTTMSKKISRPASLVKQGDLILYATSLKVSDLLIPNFYTIERLDPENANEKGYQRLLNKGRAKKLADYIVSGLETKDAFLPTSIFLATDKNIAFNPANNSIEIDIDEIGPFNVVDGQHR